MRIRKRDLTRRVKGDLRVEFCGTDLTSYAGLELLRRYFRWMGLSGLIRSHLREGLVRGDCGAVAMVRLFLGLLFVGGRRLRHVSFLRGDPVLLRFCGLAHLPSPRTLSRWLKGFRRVSVKQLQSLSAAVVALSLKGLPLRTLTLDVDGTVLCTGLQVERAFRGFNPHHRKAPSYFPITAHVGESGHILRVQNRSGNVHDGASSVPFLREVFGQVKESLPGGYRLRFRLDGAFFQSSVIGLLQARGAGYALKVPFWRWVGLKPLIQRQRRWKAVAGEVDAFEKRLRLAPWRRTLRVVLYRKRVRHRSRKNYQLDLFDPADGHYEYSAVATNLTFSTRRLWKFMCGRGAHEKVIGELKNGLAFDTIPTSHYQANSAWQQIVVLAHNLLTNFQIDTGAARRSRSHKGTALFVRKGVETLRFEWLNRAGQLLRPGGRTVLRLMSHPQTQSLFCKITQVLNQTA